jgi:hypothetical protein
MDSTALLMVKTVIVGIGSTLTFDLWAQFLKHTFKIRPSNICLVGRWLCYLPEGKFVHTNILSSPHKNGECSVGWFAHYMTGISFSLLFIVIVGAKWLQQPSPVSAIIFGAVTVIAPLFIMQPALGFGFAASKSPNPMQARFRSLMNHTAFGAGLYFFALLVNLF